MTALNQVLKPKDLKPIIQEYYNLNSPINIKLIREGFNHNYHLTTGDRQFILRVYLNHKYYIRSSDDFRFELELIEYLAQQGIPVASPSKIIKMNIYPILIFLIQLGISLYLIMQQEKN